LSTPVSGSGMRWVAVGRFYQEVIGSTNRVPISGRVLAKEPCAAFDLGRGAVDAETLVPIHDV
jgi:hypothetical protein